MMAEFEPGYLEQYAFHDNYDQQFVLGLKPGLTFVDFIESVESIEVDFGFDGMGVFDIDPINYEVIPTPPPTHRGGVLNSETFAGINKYLQSKSLLEEGVQLTPICFVDVEEGHGTFVVFAYDESMDEDLYVRFEVDDLGEVCDLVEDEEYFRTLDLTARQIPVETLPPDAQFRRFLLDNMAQENVAKDAVDARGDGEGAVG